MPCLHWQLYFALYVLLYQNGEIEHHCNLHLKLCGAGILGVGIWLRVEKGDYVSFADYEFATASNLAIAAGVVIVMVTFLGVVGSIKENRVMLLMVSYLF